MHQEGESFFFGRTTSLKIKVIAAEAIAAKMFQYYAD